LPDGSQCWLDGAHNPSAATPVASAMARWRAKGPSALVLGMLANKAAGPVLERLGAMVDLVVTVPVPNHACHAPSDLARQARDAGWDTVAAEDPANALDLIARRFGHPVRVLIAGSLYLAGQVLEQNGEAPE